MAPTLVSFVPLQGLLEPLQDAISGRVLFFACEGDHLHSDEELMPGKPPRTVPISGNSVGIEIQRARSRIALVSEQFYASCLLVFYSNTTESPTSWRLARTHLHCDLHLQKPTHLYQLAMSILNHRQIGSEIRTLYLDFETASISLRDIDPTSIWSGFPSGLRTPCPNDQKITHMLVVKRCSSQRKLCKQVWPRTPLLDYWLPTISDSQMLISLPPFAHNIMSLFSQQRPRRQLGFLIGRPLEPVFRAAWKQPSYPAGEQALPRAEALLQSFTISQLHIQAENPYLATLFSCCTPHNNLRKIEIDYVDVRASRRERDAQFCQAFEALEFQGFPALEGLQIKSCEWPTSEYDFRVLLLTSPTDERYE
ncbi:hypothetical protein BDV98DRAFT_658004 [Pterulicium gracile]|uniref:Uncharacterized protein n=1 Tax=Pterulicium gracile TaxID=1884261 RepID=A0A5C3Q890_9AGAR|nr:hypothetical protein BDV98DRAFT_658004 [Pterula gracilis]